MAIRKTTPSGGPTVEHVTEGVGMMQRERVRIRVNTPDGPAELEKYLKKATASLPVAQPGDWYDDALRRDNAERCRVILATVGLSDDGKGTVDKARLGEKGLGEDSAQWIAAHWLAAYNRLMKRRERLAGGECSPDVVAWMLNDAEELGRQQERLWWRAGVDPETGTKRETLALKGRKDTADKSRGGHMRSGKLKDSTIRILELHATGKYTQGQIARMVSIEQDEQVTTGAVKAAINRHTK